LAEEFSHCRTTTTEVRRVANTNLPAPTLRAIAGAQLPSRPTERIRASVVGDLLHGRIPRGSAQSASPSDGCNALDVRQYVAVLTNVSVSFRAAQACVAVFAIVIGNVTVPELLAFTTTLVLYGARVK